jgi:DNA repair protein RadD
MKLRYYQEGAIQSVFDYHYEHGVEAGNTIVAMPTGTGKSPTIGGLLIRLYKEWPSLRVLNLTHVKELIAQNVEKLQMMWPTAPVGIYSAGLGQRDTMLPILFGGVASIVKSEAILSQHWDIGIIDECHLLSPEEDSMYQVIVAAVMARNPRFKLIGFTATPYRLKQGLITDGGIFSDICCDLTGVDAFNRFINEAYLSPLIAKKTDVQIEASELKIVGGEYAAKPLEAEIDRIMVPGLREVCDLGQNRHKWLIFTAGVATAERCAEILNSWGVSAMAVHSKLKGSENDKRIAAHKAGQFRALINVGKLTTGYDDPGIDLIAVFRKTTSPGLWVQILGRGTRPLYMPGFDLETVEGRFEAMYAGPKQNTLVLDFAANTEELGPINDVRIPRKKGKETGDAPVRICTKEALKVNATREKWEMEDGCGAYNHASVRSCCNCGREFLFQTHILASATDAELIKGNEAVVEYFNVDRVFYSSHETSKGRSLKVTYACGMRSFREYVSIEYTDPSAHFARKRGRDWFRQRFISDGEDVTPPETVDEALQYVSRLKEPKRLRVRTDQQYPEILGHEFF